jgi:hypothetical protein
MAEGRSGFVYADLEGEWLGLRDRRVSRIDTNGLT